MGLFRCREFIRNRVTVPTLVLLAVVVLCLILVYKYSYEERNLLVKWVKGETGQGGTKIEKRQKHRQQQQQQEKSQSKPMAVVNMLKLRVKEPEFENKEYSKLEEEEHEMKEGDKHKGEFGGEEEEEEVDDGEGDNNKEGKSKGPVFEKGQDQLNRVRKYGAAHNLGSANIDAMPLDDLLFTVHSYLDNIDVICARKLRMGKVGDGGWEICDDPDVRPRAPCTIYSFGINWDFSFDDDAARLYKCHVYSFDPSMNLTTSNRSSLVHFYKLGISGSNSYFAAGRVSRLKDIRAMLGHENISIDVIKMDVESSEWLAIPNMIATKQLKDVKQLLVEFHVGNSGKKTLQRRLKVIQALETEGFKRFYVNKNPSCKVEPEPFPIARTKCYEVHYIRR